MVTMMVKAEFHFDFGSPNAYLAHRVLPDIERRVGLRFAYEPVLLGGVFKATNNAAPMIAFANIPAKLAYQRVEMQRFIKRHALNAFAFNPHFPVNTLQIMRGAVAARRLGSFEAYVETVFTAMWEQGLKMDDPAVIYETLEKAGLDAAAIVAGAATPEVKAELVASTERSVQRGTFGLPTFFIDDEIFFGKDTLRDVEDEIVARKGG